MVLLWSFSVVCSMQKSLSGLSSALTAPLYGYWAELPSGENPQPVSLLLMGLRKTCWGIHFPWSLSESLSQLFILPLHLQYHFLEEHPCHFRLLISPTVSHSSAKLIILHPHECQFPLLSRLWLYCCCFPPGPHLWLFSSFTWLYSVSFPWKLPSAEWHSNSSSTVNQLLFSLVL